MPFPSRLLQAGEEVFVDQRPHPLRLAGPVALSLVVLAGLVAVFIAWRSAPAWFGLILGVALVAIAVFFGTRLIRWRSTSFVVTSHRVIYRTGVLRRVGREIPIDAIQGVTYHQSLPGRIVGIGTIVIDSPGELGSQRVPDVRDPEAVQSAMHAALEAGSRRRATPSVVPAAASVAASARRASNDSAAQPAPDPVVELERITALHARGVITDDEFESARRAFGVAGRDDGSGLA